MEDQHLESAWQRGARDLREAMGSVKFWLVDAGGGALIGFATQPIWGFLWVASILFVTWGFVTFRAPLVQRDEARADLDLDATYYALLESVASRLWLIGKGIRLDQSNPKKQGEIKERLKKWEDTVGGFVDYLDTRSRHRFFEAAIDAHYSLLEPYVEILDDLARNGVPKPPAGDYEMTSLKDARKKALEDFIKEHEADPKGDLEKLDAVIKRPVQESAKVTQKASSQDASDD